MDNARNRREAHPAPVRRPRFRCPHRRSSPAKAKTGIFLQYDGVTAAPSHDHTDHALLSSFQFGVGRGVGAPSGGGSQRSISAPQVSEITVTHKADKYSPKLFHESLVSDGDADAVIYFMDTTVKGQDVDYLEFDLDSVIASGFSLSSGGTTPQESLSLNFAKIQMKAHFVGGTQETISYDLLGHAAG